MNWMNDDMMIIRYTNVAYSKELQISNFIYQSLSESNNNINLITGKSRITTSKL